MEENEYLLGLKELDYLPIWPLIPDTDYQYQGSTLDPSESPSEHSYETPCESLSESSCESPDESSHESSDESPLANSYESQTESSNFEECDQILLDSSSTPFDEIYADVDANMKTKLFETDDEEQLNKRLQESSEFFDSSCDEVIHEEDPTQYSPQNFQKDMSQENELFDVPISTNTVLNEIESFSNQDEYFPFSPYNSSPQISWKFVSQQQVITSPNFQPQPQPQIQPHSHYCSQTKAQGKAQAHFPSQYQMTSVLDFRLDPTWMKLKDKVGQYNGMKKWSDSWTIIKKEKKKCVYASCRYNSDKKTDYIDHLNSVHIQHPLSHCLGCCRPLYTQKKINHHVNKLRHEGKKNKSEEK